jgi:glutamyl-tRNA synthetase
MDLHIGNAYTALINYVYAKKYGGQFLIRVEDTDRTRLVEGSEERILSSLEWLGIPHDEGPDIGGPYAPYRQSDRVASYRTYAEQLVEKGHAYYCFCTADRLDQMRKAQEADHKPPMYDGLCKSLSVDEAKKRVEAGEKHVIRMKIPDTGTTTFTDLIRGEISFENSLIDDQVILKTDGYPTYHLGVVVDDHVMEISHIFRGEEWISSTPKHILLYQFFGWEIPAIGHLSVLRNPDKSKLSKRKNPVWVGDYRNRGFLPEAIKNYLGTMAWAFPGGKEFFSVEEMMGVFDIANVQTTAPVFDQEKLRWMNGEYMRRLSDTELMTKIRAFDTNLDDTQAQLLPKIVPLIRDRMKIFSEFRSLAGFFFARPESYESPLDAETKELLTHALTNASSWTHDGLEAIVRERTEKEGLKVRDVFMALRVAITGKTVGPPLLESMEILGKEECLTRLSLAQS